jgi:hypothetical protein
MRKAVPALTQVKDLDEGVLMTGGQGDWGCEIAHFENLPIFPNHRSIHFQRYASSKHLIIIGTGIADHPSSNKEAADSRLTSRRFHPVQGYLFETGTSL